MFAYDSTAITVFENKKTLIKAMLFVTLSFAMDVLGFILLYFYSKIYLKFHLFQMVPGFTMFIDISMQKGIEHSVQIKSAFLFCICLFWFVSYRIFAQF